jgi:hypothetical protein
MRVWSRSEDPEMKIAWVYSNILDELWSKDDYFVAEYGRDPNPNWFVRQKSMEGLILAEARIFEEDSIQSISISCNRHRLRWLITDKKLIEVPILMTKSDIQKGFSIGLVSRHFEEHDRIEIKI